MTTTYLDAYWKGRSHNLKYWDMKQRRQVRGKSKTFFIQYFGSNERMIRWIKEQAYAGRIRMNEAAAMIKEIEDDRSASYFFLGPKWNDLKALGYDPRNESKRRRPR